MSKLAQIIGVSVLLEKTAHAVSKNPTEAVISVGLLWLKMRKQAYAQSKETGESLDEAVAEASAKMDKIMEAQDGPSN